MSDLKEPPPKPTRIRTTVGVGSVLPGTAMINGHFPAKTSAPPRPAKVTPLVNPTPVAELGKGLAGDEARRVLPGTAGTLAKPVAMNTTTIDGPVPLRSASAPVPPPKPKRISLAPQPKAKPLSLQSIPLQKVEAPVQLMTATQPLANTAALSRTSSTPATKQGPTKQSSTLSSAAVSPMPHPVMSAPKKPSRSPEHSTDDGSPLSSTEPIPVPQQQQRPRNAMRTRQPSSPPPPPCMSTSHPNIGIPSTTEKRSDGKTGANPALIGERSRLRSVSDAKASTSLAVAVSQASRTYALDSTSLDDTGALISPTHPSSTKRNAPFETDTGEDAAEGSTGGAAAEKLTASLQKIQALAQGQTDRMKQINYAEKKADLAEAVFEKSSHWRARGAEWGGMAKKAWDDRGGMGGIAGGIADRWKRRGDGVNDGTMDYPRYTEGGRVFGLPLEDAVRISKISASKGVPAVVTRCIEYLDIMGIEEVGLYRVPGSTTSVNRLKAMFDSGHDYDLLQKGNEPQNPHDVATLLKLYLRELPSPIIPTETMMSCNSIDFTDLDQHPMQQLKDTLRNLPLENYILLGTLCQHLSNLADYESHTKMNISNLGLIFCPTLHIGSILFKNLLGGDGSEDERRKSLLVVWEDLDRRHEEMENIQMIKDFEMGLRLETNGHRSAQNGSSPTYEAEQQKEQGRHGNSARRQCWEQVNRDVLDFNASSPPPPSTIATPSSPSFTSFPISLQSSLSPIHSRENSGSKTTPAEPPLDLYDELMAREINEATNTPLIDASPPEHHLRRHAREPAMNRRSESPPPFRVAARHERLPAVSIRF